MQQDLSGPLTFLCDRLTGLTRPPHLAELVALMEEVDAVREFFRIIREFIPDHEAEIRRETYMADRIGVFAKFFEERYFPLPYYYGENQCESYEDLVAAVPIAQCCPMDADDWSSPEALAQDWVCMLLLMPFPDYYADERIPMLDTLDPKIAALFKLIPEGGYPLEDIQKACEGTPYQALWDLALCIHDSEAAPYFMVIPEETPTNDTWDKKTIDELTVEWRKTEEWNGRITGLRELLEKDLYKEVRALISFINRKLEREPFVPPPNQLPLVDLFKEVKVS